MEIKGTTRVCGLIGNPVCHSISPLIHNELAKLMEIDMAYVTFKVENGSILSAVSGAYDLNVLGLNVTVPYKQDVIKGLCDIDELALKINAVNTLVRTDSGYKGYNTDILGLKRELDEAGISLSGKCVVILGAGGASRAITFLCASEGAQEVYILNRTTDRAQALADDVNKALNVQKVYAKSLDFANDIPKKGYIVIQTTSVGLYPNCDDIPVENMKFYENASAGVDIIYNPAQTAFMKRMKACGKPAYNGLKMLLYQAVAAFELWNDLKVPDDVTDKVYYKMKKAMKIDE